MSVLRTFFKTISGQTLGSLGLLKQAYAVRGVAKTSFHRSWIFYDFRVHFGGHLGGKRAHQTPTIFTLGGPGEPIGGIGGRSRFQRFFMIFRGNMIFVLFLS